MAVVQYIGIDPGYTTGWSVVEVDTDKKQIISDTGSMFKMETVDDLLNMLVQSGKKITLVCEDFTLFFHKARAQAGSNMPASQVIGIVRSAVRRSNGRLKLVMQSSKDNKIRAQHSGRQIPSNHDKSHDIAAYNHVFEYLLVNDIIKSRMFWS